MTDGQTEVAATQNADAQPCDGTCGRHDDEEPPTLESENQQLARQMGSDNPPLGVADPRDCPPPTKEEVLDCVGTMLDRMRSAVNILSAHMENWVDAETLSDELSVAETLDQGGQREGSK